MKKNKTSGLVILMATVLAFVALAAIGIPVAAHNKREAMKTDCKAKIKEINKAIEIFKEKNDGTLTADDPIIIFPNGIPTCPIIDTQFRINQNGKVITERHNHEEY